MQDKLPLGAYKQICRSQPAASRERHTANLSGLIIGRIEAECCNQILILQNLIIYYHNLAKSKNIAHFCASPDSTLAKSYLTKYITINSTPYTDALSSEIVGEFSGFHVI